MSKRRAFVIVAVIRTAGFLFVVIGGTINSYRSGFGFYYINELDRAGLVLEPQVIESDAEIVAASKIAGIKHAAARSMTFISIFIALILIVGYAFGLPQLSIRRTITMGMFVTGLAASFSCGAQIFIGWPVDKALKAGVGIWLLAGVLFLFMIATTWGIRRTFRSRLWAWNRE